MSGAAGPGPAPGEEALDALRALREAFERAADTLERWSPPDRASALTAMGPLHRTLAAGRRVAGSVRSLVRLADPGEPLERTLPQWAADLAAVAAEVEECRRQLEERTRAEADRNALLRERTELQERLAELGRLERLSAEVEAMRGQRRALEERLALVASATEADEVALEAASRELVAATNGHTEHLRVETRRILGDVEASQAEWAAGMQALHQAHATAAAESERLGAERARLEGELAKATSRLEEVRRAHDGLSRELEETLGLVRRHAEADQQVADSLGAADAREALADLRRRVGDLEETLRAALDQRQRDRAEERRVRRPGRDA